MDDRELALLEHENMIVSLGSIVGFADNGLIQHEGGVALIDTGLPIRLFNQILVESDEASPEAVSAAIALGRARRDPFVVNLRVGSDDRFVPLVAELGLVPMTESPWMPGMGLQPIPADPVPELPGYEIRRVKDAAGLEELIGATVGGFGMDEAMVRTMVTPSILDVDVLSLYVGYANGEPVSTGVGVQTGRTIGIYNISTVPAARRRGYGEVMTRRIAQDGAKAGSDVAVLQASSMGFPIYERLGYRTVVEYMAYVEPEGATPA